MIKIEPRYFYIVGKWTFFSVALSSLISLLDNFNNLTGAEIVSKASMMIFYFAITGSFTYLQSQLAKPVATEKDMVDMLNKFDNKEDTTQCQESQKKKQI